MKRQPPFDPAFLDPVNGIYNPDADAPYVNGDPRIGRQGSIPPMEALDHPMRELVHLIEYSTQTPLHTDLEQVRKAIKWMIDNLLVIGKSGDGVDLFHGNVGGSYLFRSLVAGDNTTLTVVTNPTTGRTHIRIDTLGTGGAITGEACSNLGASGARVFKQKSALDFQFRRLIAGSGISITENTDDVTFSVPSQDQPILALKGDGGSVEVKTLGSHLTGFASDFASSGAPTFNAATGEITIPAAGVWRITGFFTTTDNAANNDANIAEIAVTVDGFSKAKFAATQIGNSYGYGCTVNIDCTLNLAAGAVVRFNIWRDQLRHIRDADGNQIIVRRLRAAV